MIYRQFQDMKLSALGLGAMRLPVIDGDDKRIDEPAVRKMVEIAMAGGINYYDTAWGYHGGNSEPVMGRVLSEYPRESFHVATKFPGFDSDCRNKVDEIFSQQLERLKVDYIDFYLLHNVCERDIDVYLDDEKYGICPYLIEQKKKGKIRHLGFSCHGDMNVLRRFLDARGKDMEFCQLQVNYLDWTLQNDREKMALLEEWGIPVWVMEPVRGGKLAKMAPEYEERLKSLRPDESAVAWAFRFILSLPSVPVILSGMSNEEQLLDNLKTFGEERKLSDHEMKELLQIADEILSEKTVPCTACRYCTSHCPQELDIPRLLELYNEFSVTGGGFYAPMVLGTMPEEKWPKACIGCRSCEQVCPQQIKISEVMAEFAEKLSKKEE